MRTGSRFALGGRHVVLTRPAGTGRALAARLRALGAEVLALPSARLGSAPDADESRAALARAARAHAVVFASPSAVRFAFRLDPGWRPRAGAACFAPGAATRAALARRGIAARTPAARLDSEGLLALPELQRVARRTIAPVGAPGRGASGRGRAARGRGRVGASGCAARGARGLGAPCTSDPLASTTTAADADERRRTRHESPSRPAAAARGRHRPDPRAACGRRRRVRAVARA